MKTGLMIYFMNESGEDVTYKQKMLLRQAVKSTLEYEGFGNDVQISVTFVDDEGIRAINNSYRNIDKPTDVLSVPLTDFEGGEEPPTDEPEVALGDIVISLERARAQAEDFGHSFDREIAFLTVHSMLHLLGYDHVDSEEDDREMRARQSAILENMGLGVK